MNPVQRSFFPRVVFVVCMSGCHAASALEFTPGVGAAVEYTDNARLTPEDPATDLIAVTYVGVDLAENEGALRYNATAAFNKQNYTRDSFADQRYVYLDASADWAMIKQRVNWNMSDNFSQVPVVATGSNTPNNLQDTNAFILAATITMPISARQSFNVVPSYNQFYYEKLFTDNNQYSLAGSWQYQAFRLSNISLNASVRTIDYTEKNILGETIIGSTFTNVSFLVSGTRKWSNYAVNAGTTNVKRDNGEETTGFAGFLNWGAEISSRSEINGTISTNLTDSSTVSINSGGAAGAGVGLQITADVIRFSTIGLSYSRDDDSFGSRFSMRYNKVTYSESPLDRLIRDFDYEVNHPVTQLLSSGVYLRYNYIKQIDTTRLDEWYTVGGKLDYSFSRKLKGSLDFKYREKQSSLNSENYSEATLYASLVYGFGSVERPTRGGGY